MKNLILVLLTFTSINSVFANGGSFGGGGGGVKPEQRQILSHMQRNSDVQNLYNLNYLQNLSSGISNGDSENTHDVLIQFNLNEIEEVTLKDGSVVKHFELLELIKK